jgi:hypothetical protein
VKIRFLRTIAGERFCFEAGRVYDVPRPTPEMLIWIRPTKTGLVRAEVVRDDVDSGEVALAATAPHVAVTPGRARARGRR